MCLALTWCLQLLFPTSSGSRQQHPHESKSLPYSLGNPMCLWVQKCLNQSALETLNAVDGG